MDTMAKKNPVLIMSPASEDNPKQSKSYSKTNLFDDNFVDEMIRKLKQERLDNMARDPKKSWRSEVQLCKLCSYSDWFGGQVITTTYCAECGKEMTFPSTNVDMYCIDCARKLNACKHCGKPMD